MTSEHGDAFTPFAEPHLALLAVQQSSTGFDSSPSRCWPSGAWRGQLFVEALAAGDADGAGGIPARGLKGSDRVPTRPNALALPGGRDDDHRRVRDRRSEEVP